MTLSDSPAWVRPPRDVHEHRDRAILCHAAKVLRERGIAHHDNQQCDERAGNLPGGDRHGPGLAASEAAGLAAVLASAARHVDCLGVGLRVELLAMADLIVQSAPETASPKLPRSNPPTSTTR